MVIKRETNPLKTSSTNGVNRHNKSTVTINRMFDLDYLERETVHAVTHSDWQRLKKRIKRIKHRGTAIINVGCLLIGIGATSLFLAITSNDIEGIKYTFFWVVAITSITAGGLLILFHFIHSHDQENNVKSDIQECMKEIEDKFPV